MRARFVWSEVERRSGELRRRDAEKKLRDAALLRSEAERLGKAIDTWRELELATADLPADARRTLTAQDSDIFRDGNQQAALEKAEEHWNALMRRASVLEWDARAVMPSRDEPRDVTHHILMWVVGAFFALTFYWPLALAVHVACTALGIDWSPPLF